MNGNIIELVLLSLLFYYIFIKHIRNNIRIFNSNLSSINLKYMDLQNIF